MVRWRQCAVLLAVLAVVAFGLGAGCTRPAASSAAAAPPLAFDAQRAWDDLTKQVAFGYRVPGTAVHKTTRDWLVAQLQTTTAKVELQPFSHKLGGRDVRMWNILAHFAGTGAAPRETILLCAHWDTRPTADHDPDPAKRKMPIAGASDGASGVAVLLEIARQLKAHPLKQDVLIALFDGEDYGPKIEDMLLGSAYFATHLPTPKPAWGILLDMVGDADLDIYREPDSEEFAKPVNDRIFAAARSLGYLRAGAVPGFVDAPYQYRIVDDHTALNKAGVPTADLIDFNYPVWHTTADTPEQCSADSLQIVGKTVLQALADTQDKVQ